ncbi:MAG: tellurite resistance TerB family protein [Myxococcales bacterium]|nr:tellurite resistance TerB family protein [Myxococcales bacterium]
MKDEQLFLDVMQIWAGAAWADGVLAPNERRLLCGLIEETEVSDATRDTARSFLDAPVKLEDARVERLGPDERMGVFRAAAKMMTVDRLVSDDERAFLRRLAPVLALDEATVRQIAVSMGLVL